MTDKQLFTKLCSCGFSPHGAAIIMGHMEAESGKVFYRLQGDFGAGLTKSKAYTCNVDAGDITRSEFVNDGPGGGGYGACQWTWYSRKAALYDFAKARGVSIGDEDMQIAFLVKELREDFADINRKLQTATDFEASDDFLFRFENPEDKSYGVQQYRRGLAEKYYNALAHLQGTETAQEAPQEEMQVEPPAPAKSMNYWPPRVLCEGMEGADVTVLQALLVAHGYDTEITGYFSHDTDTVFRAYQTDAGLISDGIAGPKSWGKLLKN